MSDELRDARDKGWFHIDHALIDEYGPQIGAVAIAVYIYLAHRANRDTGVSWPSYSTIARALDIHRSTAMQEVHRLEQHGLIRIQTARPKGKRPYNIYTLVTIGSPQRLVAQTDQSVLVAQDDQSSTATINGSPQRLVAQTDTNKNKLNKEGVPPLSGSRTRINKQEPERENRARAHTRGTGEHQARAPTPLKTIEEMLPFRLPETEWAELRSAGIPVKWAVAHVEIFIAHYENEGTERSAEEWYSKCRKWLLQDWDKAQTAAGPTRSR